jgi:hypothetical protein
MLPDGLLPQPASENSLLGWTASWQGVRQL